MKMMNQMKTKMKMRRLNEVLSVIVMFIVVLETSLGDGRGRRECQVPDVA